MKKTYTIIRLTLLAAICLLAACADAERMEDHLSQTEETMKTDPARALAMLDSISRQNIPTREQQARYALLYTQARYGSPDKAGGEIPQTKRKVIHLHHEHTRTFSIGAVDSAIRDTFKL